MKLLKKIFSLSTTVNSVPIILLACLGILSVYCTIFCRFIPNSSGGMGHDYAYYLPALLDGYFWFKTNGLWAIPWFTPSFCGGSFNYININNGYFTVCQFLTFITNPLTAVRINFMLYAGLGFFGFFVMLRVGFQLGRIFSFLGAVIFLFNGFFSHRMIIGHLSFCSFMLIPLTTLFLIRPSYRKGKLTAEQYIFDMIAAGLLFCVMIQSGFTSLIMPAILSILVIGLIHNLCYGKSRAFWMRFIGAGFFGVLFCSSKLLAIFYLMKNFSRSDYLLPGAKTFFLASWVLAKSLFISFSVDLLREKSFTNMQWALERHEWEYDVTLIPLILLLYGLFRIFMRVMKGEMSVHLNTRKFINLIVLIILLVIPIALNTYSPSWNNFLKQVPIINNSSSLVRWFIIYIPVVALLSILAIDKSVLPQKGQFIITAVSISLVILINVFTDREFYISRNYDPNEIVASYYNAKSDSWKPEISFVIAYHDKNGNEIMPIFRNNSLAHGASQLFCYEPLFGYRLENFPIKTLHPGPVFDSKNGDLNIKNPACYVWPEENGCTPGDHFKKDQAKEAEYFVSYTPYSFNMTLLQKIANWANVLSLIGALMFMLYYTWRRILLLWWRKICNYID